MPNRRADKDTFERFYLKEVALSEGCGCAEHVIREVRFVSSGNSLHVIWAALKQRFSKPTLSTMT